MARIWMWLTEATKGALIVIHPQRVVTKREEGRVSVSDNRHGGMYYLWRCML